MRRINQSSSLQTFSPLSSFSWGETKTRLCAGVTKVKRSKGSGALSVQKLGDRRAACGEFFIKHRPEIMGKKGKATGGSGKKGKISNTAGLGNGQTYHNLDIRDNGPSLSKKSKGKKGSSKHNKKNNGSTTTTSSSSGGDFSGAAMNDNAFRYSLELSRDKAIVEMTSDGNCLFRALSDQLYGDYGHRHYDIVRQEICNYMALRESEFVHFLVLDDHDAKRLGEEDASSYQDYIDQMRTDGEWGGNVELVATSRLYQRNITVYTPDGAFSIEWSDGSSVDRDASVPYPDPHDQEGLSEEDRALSVSYHEGDHYNSVRIEGRPIRPPKGLQVMDAIDPPKKSVKKGKGRKASKGGAPNEVVASAAEKTSTSAPLSSGEVQSDQFSHPSGQPNATSHTPLGAELTIVRTDNGKDAPTNLPCSSASTSRSAGNQSSMENIKATKQSLKNEETSRQTKKPAITRRNDSCPCESGLRFKKCCQPRLKHEKLVERVKGTTSDAAVAAADDSPTKPPVTFNGEFRVLKI
jgi:hypothetical protein